MSSSGELVTGVPLAAPENTTTVRAVDGVPAATDGPYSEDKEQLAGYCMPSGGTCWNRPATPGGPRPHTVLPCG